VGYALGTQPGTLLDSKFVAVTFVTRRVFEENSQVAIP